MIIIKDFPDLHWLKKQIKSDFKAQQAYTGEVLPTKGWPTVILNARTKEVSRPDILGPLSLFMNLKGTSRCKADTEWVTVNEASYFLSNPGQSYSLEVNDIEETETFNIHIGAHLCEKIWYAHTSSAVVALDDEGLEAERQVNFFNRLYPKSERINQTVQRIIRAEQEGKRDPLFLEEQLEQLILNLLDVHQELQEKIAGLPLVKSSTRTEIFRRLSLATDYLYSQYAQPIDLEKLAKASCLSKFHFSRLFKQAFDCTPYQFLVQVRLKRSIELLSETKLSVLDISEKVGFEHPASFSRSFYRKMACYPSQYRALIS